MAEILVNLIRKRNKLLLFFMINGTHPARDVHFREKIFLCSFSAINPFFCVHFYFYLLNLFDY